MAITFAGSLLFVLPLLNGLLLNGLLPAADGAEPWPLGLGSFEFAFWFAPWAAANLPLFARLLALPKAGLAPVGIEAALAFFCCWFLLLLFAELPLASLPLVGLAAIKLAELADPIGLLAGEANPLGLESAPSGPVNCFGSGGDLMKEGRVGLARAVSMGVNLALFRVFRRAKRLANLWSE